MAKKIYSSGLVYSTNKELMQDEPEISGEPVQPASQQLLVMLDKKQRAGKVVTLVEGFKGPGIEALGKQLKNTCGTGGSVKDGLIIIQGDNREKILQWLLKYGYQLTRRK